MRCRSALVFFSVLVVLAACGGSSDPEAAPAPEAPTSTPDEGAGDGLDADAPDELAFAESDVTIEGDTGVLVTPGETVNVDHLVFNTAGRSRSVAYRADLDDDVPLQIELSGDSSRLSTGEIESLVSTVTVPADAAPGTVFEYRVVAVNTEDISERSVTTVQLLVTEATGQRPDAGPDAGLTTTNERVLVYVVGDDTDPDGDLDIASVRVIAGGFSADSLEGDGNGTITYVPFANVVGDDVVMYEVCDSEQRCDTGLISITVEG